MPDAQSQQDNLVINYRVLKARKAFLELQNEDLVKRTGMGSQTVSGFLNGKKSLNLQSLARLAAELGLQVIIDFKPIEEQQ